MQPNTCTVKHAFDPSIFKNRYEIILNTYASLQQDLKNRHTVKNISSVFQ